MSDFLTRRRFLSCAGSAALLGPLISCKAMTHPENRFSMGLSQYSLRALFRSGELDPLDYPQFSVDRFGIRNVDYWEGGLPGERLDDTVYLEKIRRRAEAAGTNLFLLMTGKVDGSASTLSGNAPIVAAIERARILGAPYLRVFLGAPNVEATAAVTASVESLKPLADKAAANGVKLAIEPGLSKHSEQGAFLAKVCQSLNHPNCVLMPDFGKLRGDIYAGTTAMMPYAEVVSCKMHSFDDAGQQIDFDYERLMKIVVDSGYRGILAIEWEGKYLEPVPGVLASKRVIENSLRVAGESI